MRQARALALSLLFHLLPLGVYFFFYAQPSLMVKEVRDPAPDDYVVEAPLGQVFVQEAALGEEEKKLVPKEPLSSEEQKPMAFPEQLKEAPAQRTDGQPEELGIAPLGSPEGEARPMGKIEPSYPLISRRLGEEGEAEFLLSINPDGTVTTADLERSSGHERLDASARDALLSATFAVSKTEAAHGSARKRYRVEFRLEPKTR